MWCAAVSGANGAAVGVMRMDAVQCAGVWYAAVLLCVWRPPSVNVVAYKDITTAGSRKAVRVYNVLQI